MMGDILLCILAFMWLSQVVRGQRIRNARVADIQTEEALERWLREHPSQELSWPAAQELLRRRLATWRAYVKACLALDDGGTLERYLEAYLEGGPKQAP